ncbi:YcaO-like family protein, partial [Nocardioides sp.]|uniref:YcaO-like family protein n=1 Tax=Nocardioides sp. TaxID=35761 RepID=UPI002ED45577
QPTPRIDPASCVGLSSEIDALLSSAPSGSRWYLSLLTVDLDVPVVAALLIDDAGRPMTSLGIAADADPSHAILLALEEALLTRFMLTRSPELRARGPLGGDCATLRDHALVHADSRELRERMGFLLDDGPLLAADDVAARFAGRPNALSVLLAADFDVLTVDVTTEDVARAGLVVVRSIVPGLQPLDNDHRYRYLGGRRVSVTEPNPDPHPFP